MLAKPLSRFVVVLVALAPLSCEPLNTTDVHPGNASKSGVLGDQQTASVIAQPTGSFPIVLEPAGATQIAFADGSSRTFPGYSGTWGSAGTDRLDVVADATSKYGNTLEKRGFVGDPSGRLVAWAGIGNANRREIYIRLVVKLSDNFDYHLSGNKYFYWGRKIGGGVGQSATQYYVNFNQGFKLRFISQASTPGGSYVHNGVSSSLASAAFEPNTSIGGMTRNEWHTVEILHRMNTAPGVFDGGLRVAFDGVEIPLWKRVGGTSTDIDLTDGVEWIDNSGGNVWPDLKFSGGAFFLWWGGQGDTKQVNDWIRLSELYISGSDSTTSPPPPPTGIGQPVPVSVRQGNNHSGSITFTVGAGGVPQDATLFVDYAVYANDAVTSISVADDGGNVYVSDWEESDHAGTIGFNALQWGRWRTRVATALSQGSTITISGFGTGPTTRRFRAHAYYVEGLAEVPLIDVSVSGADQNPSGDITANPAAIFLGSMYTRCTDLTSEDVDFTAVSEGGPGVSIRPVRLRTSYRIITSAQETRGYEANPGGSCTAYRTGVSAYQAAQP